MLGELLTDKWTRTSNSTRPAHEPTRVDEAGFPSGTNGKATWTRDELHERRCRVEFVDTNILIYAYDSSRAKAGIARQPPPGSMWAAAGGCVSIQVLQEFYAVGTRKLPKSRRMTLSRAVRDLVQWHVFRPTETDVLAAIDLHQRHQISFWDAMIVHSARELGCTTLWSEDLNHGQVIGGVTIRNPFVVAADRREGS